MAKWQVSIDLSDDKKLANLLATLASAVETYGSRFVTEQGEIPCRFGRDITGTVRLEYLGTESGELVLSAEDEKFLADLNKAF